jgi:hypothetical protein
MQIFIKYKVKYIIQMKKKEDPWIYFVKQFVVILIYMKKIINLKK